MLMLMAMMRVVGGRGCRCDEPPLLPSPLSSKITLMNMGRVDGVRSGGRGH